MTGRLPCGPNIPNIPPVETKVEAGKVGEGSINPIERIFDALEEVGNRLPDKEKRNTFLSSLREGRASMNRAVAWLCMGCKLEEPESIYRNVEEAYKLCQRWAKQTSFYIRCPLFEVFPAPEMERMEKGVKRETLTYEALKRVGLVGEEEKTLGEIVEGTPELTVEGKGEGRRWKITGRDEITVYFKDEKLPGVYVTLVLSRQGKRVYVGVEFELLQQAFVYAVRACLLQRLQEGKIPEP